MSAITPATPDYAYPQLNVDPDKLIALTQEMVSAGFGYGLGAKISPLSLQGDDLIGTAEDGSHVKEVDCSGFVRWAVYHATAASGDALAIPDGSATQHEWFASQGFKVSSYAAGTDQDGTIRIGFLTPEDGGGTGHVVLIWNGETMESHGREADGSQGPSRRVWDARVYPWMGEMFVFVVAL